MPPSKRFSIEVPCADPTRCDDELYHRTEHMILSIGAPFVPMKHDGVIYVRPPIG